MRHAHARTTSRPMPQRGKGNARLPAPSLVGAIVIPCANPPVPVASLLVAEPVVTTRRSSVPTVSYVVLAQVMAPSDGFPDPSSSQAVQCGRQFIRAMRIVNKRRNGPPPNLGSRLSRGTTPHREHPRCQEPRAAVASSETTAQTGSGVSRVPRSSHLAQAGETDRNTDQT